MAIRYLINTDGSSFDLSEIQKMSRSLDGLADEKRELYRNKNSSRIAKLSNSKVLIVSGPGTGKSYLFLDRINFWYRENPDARVFVTTFVRKLVADLNNDIEGDSKLTEEQKESINVSTLHRFARKVVEKNHGTKKWSFKPHFRIISQRWDEVVWEDVLSLNPKISKGNYSWEEFESQLHNNSFHNTEDWMKIKETYYSLCQFYNAAGFADLILRARKVLEEKPDLNKYNYFIIDEYQDFNLAEESLIEQLVDCNAESILVVGDDEQVLYEKLKSGKATLIRKLYKNNEYVNCMLPFTGRSGYHITKAAYHFIQQLSKDKSIKKIFLPLKTQDDRPKVQIVACATPPTAVDYIEKFIEDNRSKIEDRKKELEEGTKKDPFLLILTPSRDIKFYGKAKERLEEIVSRYQREKKFLSEDYYKLLNYYSLANNPQNNFTFRKVMHHENLNQKSIGELINKAISGDKNFCDIESKEIDGVARKCEKVREILNTEAPSSQKIRELSEYVSITDPEKLKKDIEEKLMTDDGVAKMEHKEDEEAELEEIEVKKMDAVEVMTIVGSKGLSADNVIIIGFDDINMKLSTKNAFYVAITRSRNSLHLLTALRSGGASQPHKFLEKLPEDHLEFYTYKKGDRTKSKLSNKKSFVNYIKKINSFSK